MAPTPGMSKAWWAEGLIGTRNSMRLSEQLAKAHAFSHLERSSQQARDDVVIDSPTTHYHPQVPNPWPWVALTAAILAGAGLASWALISRTAPTLTAPATQPTPPPPAPGQPAARNWLEFYRP